MASRSATKNGGRPAAQIVRGEAVVDLAAAESAVADLLRALGHDPTSAGLADTHRHISGRLRGVADAQVLHPDDVRQR